MPPRKQASTRVVSIRSIVASREFARGFEEVRKGEALDTNNTDWDYERGRQFACLLPLHMQLKVKGKLNPKALEVARLAFERDEAASVGALVICP
jgi:hypothetical protein